MKAAANKNLIRYLLILCIGLTPAISPGAVDLQPMDHAASVCPDCNPASMAIDSECANESCPSITHACGANYCAGPVPAYSASTGHRFYRILNPINGADSIRSRRAESIYRPPIA